MIQADMWKELPLFFCGEDQDPFYYDGAFWRFSVCGQTYGSALYLPTDSDDQSSQDMFL